MRARFKAAAHNLAVLKHIALDLIRFDPVIRKGGINARRLMAAASAAYTEPNCPGSPDVHAIAQGGTQAVLPFVVFTGRLGRMTTAHQPGQAGQELLLISCHPGASLLFEECTTQSAKWSFWTISAKDSVSVCILLILKGIK
jgi:hypothetical protein